MIRPRLGLDLDGVVYDFHSAARSLLMQRLGHGLPEVDEIWNVWDGHKRFMSNKDEDWLWGEGVRLGLFRHGHILKGAIEALREINKIADVVVLTHRPLEARQDTLDWLSFHKIPTSEIHMMHKGEPKWRVECDLYLDDKWENIVGFYSMRPKSLPLLWTRAWNNKESYSFRVREWKSVMDWIEAITVRGRSPRSDQWRQT